jgi:integrase
VSLPAGLVEMLEDQLARPEVVRSGLVFPTPQGEPMRRSNFARRAWASATRAIGVEGPRFHDLRHTAVALSIQQGAHPKAIQERLGHSSVTVTLDRYGHLYQGLDGELADGLDAILRNSRGLAAAWAPPRGPCRRRSRGRRRRSGKWG